jgi:serine/threonine protein kinase
MLIHADVNVVARRITSRINLGMNLIRPSAAFFIGLFILFTGNAVAHASRAPRGGMPLVARWTVALCDVMPWSIESTRRIVGLLKEAQDRKEQPRVGGFILPLPEKWRDADGSTQGPFLQFISLLGASKTCGFSIDKLISGGAYVGGTVGNVFRCEYRDDIGEKHVVAVKRIAWSEGEERPVSLIEEALIQCLAYPFSAKVLGIVPLEQDFVIVSEWKDMGTLASWLPYFRSLYWHMLISNPASSKHQRQIFYMAAVAKRFLLPLVDIIEALNTRGIFHNDLAWDNIAITKHGVVLLDFGSAKYNAFSGGSRSIPVICAPEVVVHGWSAVGQKSEVWHFGVLFLSLLKRKYIFDEIWANASVDHIESMLQTDQLLETLDCEPSRFPEPIAVIIRACLATKSEQRSEWHVIKRMLLSLVQDFDEKSEVGEEKIRNLIQLLESKAKKITPVIAGLVMAKKDV